MEDAQRAVDMGSLKTLSKMTKTYAMGVPTRTALSTTKAVDDFSRLARERKL